MVFVVIFGRSGILAPAGLQGFGDRLWLCELEVAGFFRDDGTFRLWLQLGNKLGDEAASLLWVQVAGFFRDINKRSDDLVVAFFSSFTGGTARATNLNGQLFTVGVSDKLARLLFNVAGSAGTFVESFALLWTTSIADFFDWLVAFFDSLIECLLLESDLTSLLKVFLANLLLRSIKLCDVRVVTLLQVLVGALKDGVFLKRCHLLILLDAAEASLGIRLAAGEVNAALNFAALVLGLSALPGKISLSNSYA